MNKDDGGSAFPNAPLYGLEENNGVYELLVDEQGSGMTLRDYFAAKAMQTLISKANTNTTQNIVISQFKAISVLAYCAADAMLKARES